MVYKAVVFFPKRNGCNFYNNRRGLNSAHNGENEIIVANRAGRAIRFNETKVREMGRTATGVRGMKLTYDLINAETGKVVAKKGEKLIAAKANKLAKDGILKARYNAIDTPESTIKVEEWGKAAL